MARNARSNKLTRRDELKRLNGELNSLERSIAKLEFQPVAAEPIELGNVTDALQRIDPIWEVLHPEEQRRVLELCQRKTSRFAFERTV